MDTDLVRLLDTLLHKQHAQTITDDELFLKDELVKYLLKQTKES